jgi:uncharacterized membrane protein
MDLTPEEKHRIYEEEKARLEEKERLEREKRQEAASTTGLEPNIAGLLCYLGLWITGIIMLVLERNNKFVRFHAAQSIVVFGSLTILSGALGFVPFAGQFFSAAIGIVIFILWLVLMVKAYRAEFYRLPVAAEVADWLLAVIAAPGQAGAPGTQPRPEQVVTLKEAPAPGPARVGEIIGSIMAIVFSLAAFIFLNFFHDYVAYYSQTGGVWVRQPLLTSAYGSWLPVLDVAIALTIIGHVILILTGQRLVRETVLVLLDVFALISLGSLLSIFPFNFYVIPDVGSAVTWAVRLGLALAVVGVGIGVIVRLIRLVANIVRS